MLLMPHKFDAERRDKIPKQKLRVTNWAEYNESLRHRAGRSRVDNLSIRSGD
jgi:hypothetical protein